MDAILFNPTVTLSRSYDDLILTLIDDVGHKVRLILPNKRDALGRMQAIALDFNAAMHLQPEAADPNKFTTSNPTTALALTAAAMLLDEAEPGA